MQRVTVHHYHLVSLLHALRAITVNTLAINSIHAKGMPIALRYQALQAAYKYCRPGDDAALCAQQTQGSCQLSQSLGRKSKRLPSVMQHDCTRNAHNAHPHMTDTQASLAYMRSLARAEVGCHCMPFC
jgi:hypothetical protein